MWHLPRHGRRLKLFGNRKSMDDALPLDFGILEIDEKTDGPAGGSQIVETLRAVCSPESRPTHFGSTPHTSSTRRSAEGSFAYWTSRRLRSVLHRWRDLSESEAARTVLLPPGRIAVLP